MSSWHLYVRRQATHSSLVIKQLQYILGVVFSSHEAHQGVRIEGVETLL